MKKTMLFFAICALAFGACRSLRVSDFHTKEAIPQRLPRLGLLVHGRSFEDAFFTDLQRDLLLQNVVAGPYIPVPWEVNQGMKDMFKALENELFDNINQAGDDRYGHARFKLLFYQRRNTGWGWIVPSVATFWTANLLGMPCSVLRVDVELQMEITDANGKVLSHYNASGSGKGRIAAYHGYDALTATRKANLVAIQEALSSIKTRLAADVPSLAGQLESAGAVVK